MIHPEFRLKSLAIALFTLPILASGENTIPPISTDRPTFSDGASLVATGLVQIESGFTQNATPGADTFTYGELLTRYGISNRFELRLTNVTWTHFTGQTSGFQDPLIGVKFWIQTGSAKRPDLSGEIETSAPVGASAFRVNRTQPTAKLIWNQQLDPKTTLTGNFVISDIGPNGAIFTQYAASTFLTRAINAKLSAFAEIYGLAPVSYGGQNAGFFDVGTTYLVTNSFQLDARIGSGLDESRDGHFFGFGASYRF